MQCRSALAAIASGARDICCCSKLASRERASRDTTNTGTIQGNCVLYYKATPLLRAQINCHHCCGLQSGCCLLLPPPPSAGEPVRRHHHRRSRCPPRPTKSITSSERSRSGASGGPSLSTWRPSEGLATQQLPSDRHAAEGTGAAAVRTRVRPAPRWPAQPRRPQPRPAPLLPPPPRRPP